MSDDPHNLRRFLDAQHVTYAPALAELHAGRKVGHWMWFVFPQLAGLGRSSTAIRYAITSLDEARAYLAHPILGARLLECVQALLSLPPGYSAIAVLGEIDAMKLRSSLTLFEAAGDEGLFGAALDRWFSSTRDSATLHLLGRSS